MSVSANRIFHCNVNCSSLDTSLRFYESLGLTKVIRTVPSKHQNGNAFGLDVVAWDAWMMHSDDGMEGLSLDLLQWLTPLPTGQAQDVNGDIGFNRLVFYSRDVDAAVKQSIAAGGSLVSEPITFDTGHHPVTVAMVRDPDGLPVQLVQGEKNSIAQIVVNCADLEESVAYYRDVMGLEILMPPMEQSWPGPLFGQDGDINVRAALLRDPGSVFVVALVQWPGVDAATKRERKANELGLFRMAWSTPDCASDEGVIRAAGSVPFVATEELSVGDDLPLLLVLFWPGPNGECLELIETTNRSGAL